jgi:aryl-alcohol dehydrogenase-like predicted oxidoreductase
MEYRALGRTGLRVSAIGFGTWGIGGVTAGQLSYGPTDDAESLRALAAALDAGITFYGTAGVYGDGHSERLLARAFAGKRDRVVIASKAGYTENFARQDFSFGHVVKSVERSLRRLRTDYLDLYQLHSPPLTPDTDVDELLWPLRALARQGKVRSCGISLRSPEDALRAIACGVDAIQINFNLMDQRARTLGVLAAAARGGTGVIVRTPLASGFLSGPLDTAAFHPRDHRAARPADQLERWTAGAARFAALNEASRTPAQLALQYCLAAEGVSTIVPGMMRVSEVEENVGALGAARLTDRELYAIEDVYESHEFIVQGKTFRVGPATSP